VPETPGALGGYYHELAYFVDCVQRGVPVNISTGEHATESLRVVLAEIESARTTKLIHLNP
jgi:predicted dehydrogenase